MKTYQKLIAYPLIAASLAGLAGCGRDAPKQATNNNPLLEQVVEKPNPTPPVEISPTLVYNRNGLFDLLSKTRGTFLNSVQLYTDDPLAEAHLARERKSFGTDYNDLLSDLIENISGMEYERAKALMQSAELVARQMNPKGDFKKDLVGLAYKQAAQYAKSGYITSASRNIQLGKMLATEIGIDTKGYVTPIAKAAFDKAVEEIKGGYLNSARRRIKFGKSIAAENGIDVREYATYVVQTAINVASSDIQGGWLNSARGKLEFGKEVAKGNGLDDFVSRIEQMTASIRK